MKVKDSSMLERNPNSLMTSYEQVLGACGKEKFPFNRKKEV